MFTEIGTDSHVRSRWDVIHKAIGRQECRWKDLRASFATYCLMGGGSPRELQDILTICRTKRQTAPTSRSQQTP